jgi:hypothetical protein
VVDTVPERSYGNFGHDLAEIEGRVRTYSELQLTHESDVYRAFAGIGRQIKRLLKCDLCQGLPTAFFD